MNKRNYILFIFSILTSTVFGQFVGKDNLSISLFYMQKTELDSAKKYIDLAIIDENLNIIPKTWYYRGYIYKELYKNKEKNNKISPFRLTSIEAFRHMLTLEGNEEFSESVYKILKYEASTLYNDAKRSLDTKEYDLAISSYELYRQTMLIINPITDLKTQDVQFKLGLAYKLRSKETEPKIDSSDVYRIKSIYLEVLLIDSNNPSANYNLARLYYNEGADIINNMDYDMDIMKLNEIQDKCIDIFLKGLPYMKKAHELNYKRRETLIGLSNIYLGLNDTEKSDSYKKELQDLEKE